MIKNLQGLLDQLEAIAPVFATDIRKDEVKENKSFFMMMMATSKSLTRQQINISKNFIYIL